MMTGDCMKKVPWCMCELGGAVTAYFATSGRLSDQVPIGFRWPSVYPGAKSVQQVLLSR